MQWEAISAATAVIVAVASAAWTAMTWRQGQHTGKAIEALQRQQADALTRMAEAMERQFRQRSGRGEAEVSARLERRDRGHRLVIRNTGPGVAELIGVQALGQPDVLIDPGDVAMMELQPGAEHGVLAAITFGTKLPLRVLLQWVDGAGARSKELVVPMS